MKPATTGCEMKFTTRPRRSAPSSTINAPARKASVPASRTYSALPGTARGASDAKVISEIAFVGPETVCSEEPNSAATAVGTMAA